MLSNAEWMRQINLVRNANWTPAYNRMFDSLRNDENILRKQEIIYIIEDESEEPPSLLDHNGIQEDANYFGDHPAFYYCLRLTLAQDWFLYRWYKSSEIPGDLINLALRFSYRHEQQAHINF